MPNDDQVVQRETVKITGEELQQTIGFGSPTCDEPPSLAENCAIAEVIDPVDRFMYDKDPFERGERLLDSIHFDQYYSLEFRSRSPRGRWGVVQISPIEDGLYTFYAGYTGLPTPKTLVHPAWTESIPENALSPVCTVDTSNLCHPLHQATQYLLQGGQDYWVTFGPTSIDAHRYLVVKE